MIRSYRREPKSFRAGVAPMNARMELHCSCCQVGRGRGVHVSWCWFVALSKPAEFGFTASYIPKDPCRIHIFIVNREVIYGGSHHEVVVEVKEERVSQASTRLQLLLPCPGTTQIFLEILSPVLHLHIALHSSMLKSTLPICRIFEYLVPPRNLAEVKVIPL